MQVEQPNQNDGGSSIWWTIVKVIFVLFIVYFGIMYFANKDKNVEKGFVEQKQPKKTTKKKQTKKKKL